MMTDRFFMRTSLKNLNSNTISYSTGSARQFSDRSFSLLFRNQQAGVPVFFSKSTRSHRDTLPRPVETGSGMQTHRSALRACHVRLDLQALTHVADLRSTAAQPC